MSSDALRDRRRDVRSVVVMGVSGSGKSTVGELLATRFDGEFLDADALHPATNVAKMASGTPLSDDDRWPWLETVGQHIEDLASRGVTSITACSALKRRYRDVLRGYVPDLVFIDLDASRASIATRLESRSGSFMPPSLLDSQFADLEPLENDERGLRVNAELTPDEITTLVASYLSAT